MLKKYVGEKSIKQHIIKFTARCFLPIKIIGHIPLYKNMNARIDHIYTMFVAIAILFLQFAALPAQNLPSKQDQTVQEKEYEGTHKLVVGVGTVLALCVALSAFFTVQSRRNVQKLRNSLAETSTELVQTQSNLATTTLQLAEASQFRFQMLNIAAHELKNPLVAIVNFAELLNEPDLTPTERGVIIGQATGMAERALGLITSLLDAHRLEIGQVRAHIGSVSLLPMLHGLVETYRELAKHKSIIIFNEYTYPSTSEIRVQADETMMRQVLENIISNAVKFSPFNKTILIRVVEVDAASLDSTIPLLPNNQEPLPQNIRIQANKRIRVEVQDEGQGISPEDMQKMFGLFTRLSARPTGGESSTGVGLSIVKRMVEGMNGRVWCESELGMGTTFIVELVASDQGMRPV